MKLLLILIVDKNEFKDFNKIKSQKLNFINKKRAIICEK